MIERSSILGLEVILSARSAMGHADIVLIQDERAFILYLRCRVR